MKKYLVVLLYFLFIPFALCQVFTVTTGNDIVDDTDGLLSLREAANLAQSNDLLDGIKIAVRKVTLDSPIVIADDAIFLEGNGAIFDGRRNTQLFDVSNSFMDISSCKFVNGNSPGDGGAFLVTVSQITFTNCSFEKNQAANNGGAVQVNGEPDVLTFADFINCRLERNTAGNNGGAVSIDFDSNSLSNDSVFKKNRAGNSGGAIANDGILDAILRCVFEGNEATNGSGGGIFNDAGGEPLDIFSNIFEENLAGNNGGGFANDDGDTLATFANCTFRRNKCNGNGGGYSTGAGGDDNFEDCLFLNNQAGINGGGVSTFAFVGSNLLDVTFKGNKANENGGGLFCGLDSAINLLRCTFESNKAFQGGGIFSDTTFQLNAVNVTLFKNRAAGNGGGFFSNDGFDAFLHCTIANNRAREEGGGMSIEAGSFTLLNSCAIIKNKARDNDDLAGNNYTVDQGTGGGFNFVTDAGESGIVHGVDGNLDRAANNGLVFGLSAKLNNKGGTVKTLIIKNENSDLVDNADPNNGIAEDSREFLRPAGDNSDIGAFEFNATEPTVVTGFNASAILSQEGVQLQWHNPQCAGKIVAFDILRRQGKERKFQKITPLQILVTKGQTYSYHDPLIVGKKAKVTYKIQCTTDNGSKINSKNIYVRKKRAHSKKMAELLQFMKTAQQK